MLTLPGDLFYGNRTGYTPPTLGSSYGGDFRPTLPPNFTTPDLNALHADTLRSKLAHAALIQGQQSQADSDNQLLQSATKDEIDNATNGAPRTPREARIQQIIQGDVSAKDRGAQLIPSWRTMLEYNHGLLQNEQLKNQIYSGNQDRQLKPKEFQLQLDQFGNVKSNQAFEHQAKTTEQNLNQAKLDSENSFREWQKAHETKQDAATQQRLTDQEFMQVQRNVQNGEISADAAIAAMPNLSQAQQYVLRGHQVAFEQNAAQAQKAADQWNQRLADSTPQPVQGQPTWLNTIGIGSPSTYNPSESEIQASHAMVKYQFDHDRTAPKLVMFNPDNNRFEPVLKLQPRAPSTGPGGATYDPVPPWLRTNQLTGAPSYDTPSGPLPDASIPQSGFEGPPGPSWLRPNYGGGTGDSSAFSGPPAASPSFAPTPTASAITPRLGNYPIGNYPSNSSGAPRYVEDRDGNLYQVINGQPVKTNLRRR